MPKDLYRLEYEQLDNYGPFFTTVIRAKHTWRRLKGKR